MRCVNLNDENNYWTTFWNDNWSPQDIRAQLAFYASSGMNAVKIYCDGMAPLHPTGNGLPSNTAYPPDAVLLRRIKWFLHQVRSLRLRIFLAMNQSVEFAASGSTIGRDKNLRKQQKILLWFVEHGHELVIALDMCNEMNRGVASWGVTSYGTDATAAAIADMSALNAMVRVSVPWPVTASVYMGARDAYAANGWLDLQYELGCDFHDYHPYYSFPAPATGQVPLSEDLIPLETRPKFIGRHLMGECGTGLSNSVEGDGGQSFPAGWRTRFCDGLGSQAARSASLGANYFCSRAYNNGSTTSTYGIFGATLAEADPETMAALRRWPAHITDHACRRSWSARHRPNLSR